MTQTCLSIGNNTPREVEVFLTLGTTPGCVQDVADIPFITNILNPLQGSFILKEKQSVSYVSPRTVGINGNIAFGSPPLNCPSEKFKNGINLAEFILNNYLQGENAQETVDISAVSGVNCQIEFQLIGGGIWNASSLHPEVKTFQNKPIGQNSGCVGVYPYLCDQCTESVSPPQCSNPPIDDPKSPIPQKEPICNVQRNASEFGGEVLILFHGFYEID